MTAPSRLIYIVCWFAVARYIFLVAEGDSGGGVTSDAGEENADELSETSYVEGNAAAEKKQSGSILTHVKKRRRLRDVIYWSIVCFIWFSLDYNLVVNDFPYVLQQMIAMGWYIPVILLFFPLRRYLVFCAADPVHAGTARWFLGLRTVTGVWTLLTVLFVFWDLVLDLLGILFLLFIVYCCCEKYYHVRGVVQYLKGTPK